ncbi:SDR family oxidoreductase, partial [Xylella fastidiosa]|nr:SDR family oxidoreductase [Xylella fastidiosa]
ETYWGRVNPVGIRSCYDEGKRCAETLFFDYWRQHKLEIKVTRILIPMVRACIPMMVGGE